jgi:hypothetical protein
VTSLERCGAVDLTQEIRPHVRGGRVPSGWLFATHLAQPGAFWWLFISMHTYGGLAAPCWPGWRCWHWRARWHSITPSALRRLFHDLCQAIPSVKKVVSQLSVFASLWTLAELARGQFFTGFPWGAGGYAHVEGLLSELCPVGGRVRCWRGGGLGRFHAARPGVDLPGAVAARGGAGCSRPDPALGCPLGDAVVHARQRRAGCGLAAGQYPPG